MIIRSRSCPTTQLRTTYNDAFHPSRAFTSTANVLTVVRHPQYPSPRPCSKEHASGEMEGIPWRTWNTPRSAVPSAFAVKVPRGKSLIRGLRLIESRYLVSVPGKENRRAAVA